MQLILKGIHWLNGIFSRLDWLGHSFTYSLTILGIHQRRTRQRSGGNCGEVLNYTPADQRDHTSFDLGREIVLFQRNARGVCVTKEEKFDWPFSGTYLYAFLFSWFKSYLKGAIKCYLQSHFDCGKEISLINKSTKTEIGGTRRMRSEGLFEGVFGWNENCKAILWSSCAFLVPKPSWVKMRYQMNFKCWIVFRYNLYSLSAAVFPAIVSLHLLYCCCTSGGNGGDCCGQREM